MSFSVLTRRVRCNCESLASSTTMIASRLACRFDSGLLGEGIHLAVEPLFRLGKPKIRLLHPLVAAAARVIVSAFRHVGAGVCKFFQTLCVWHSRASCDYFSALSTRPRWFGSCSKPYTAPLQLIKRTSRPGAYGRV